MAFSTHSADDLIWALLRGHGVRVGSNKDFAPAEDILAPVLLTGFSVLQGYIGWVLIRQLRAVEKPFWRPRNVFVLVNITLSVGYITCTCLAITSQCLKLEFLAELQKFAWSREFGNASATLEDCLDPNVHYWVEDCWNETLRSIRNMTTFLDSFMRGTFQLMVIFADALLVYRCWLLLSSPWSWIITITALLLLLISIGVFLVLLIPSTLVQSGVLAYVTGGLRWYACIYSPLLISLIVSPALMIRLWREQRELGILLGGNGQLVYRRILRALFESAIPPLALGLLHPILTFQFALRSICYNLTWITFTILAPQIIALRVSQARKRPLAYSPGMATLAFQVKAPEVVTSASSISGASCD